MDTSALLHCHLHFHSSVREVGGQYLSPIKYLLLGFWDT